MQTHQNHHLQNDNQSQIDILPPTQSNPFIRQQQNDDNSEKLSKIKTHQNLIHIYQFNTLISKQHTKFNQFKLKTLKKFTKASISINQNHNIKQKHNYLKIKQLQRKDIILGNKPTFNNSLIEQRVNNNLDRCYEGRHHPLLMRLKKVVFNPLGRSISIMSIRTIQSNISQSVSLARKRSIF